MKRVASQEIPKQAKKICAGSASPITYEDILSALDMLDLDLGEMLNLSRKLDGLVSSKINQITQNFPTELWNLILQDKACLHKLPTRVLLPLRTVCTSWNKVICSFTKINTSGVFTNRRFSKFFTIFPLRSLTFTRLTHPPLNFADFPLLTQVNKLKLKEAGTLSSFFTPLTNLTNLTKLSLYSTPITSLQPLTGLQELSLLGSFPRSLPGLSRLPALTKLTSDTRRVFKRWTGKGVFKDENGAVIYDGDFVKGEYHGQGIEHYEGGAWYEGTFENGEKQGMGIDYWPHGVMYSGDHKDGMRHGRGKFVYAGGDAYEGGFKDGLCHGEGVYLLVNGDKFVGTWEGNNITGHGIYYWINGDRLEGLFKGMEGEGTKHFVDGTREEGVLWKFGEK